MKPSQCCDILDCQNASHPNFTKKTTPQTKTQRFLAVLNKFSNRIQSENKMHGTYSAFPLPAEECCSSAWWHTQRATARKEKKEVWVKMRLNYSIYSMTFKLASYTSVARPLNTGSISETQLPSLHAFQEGLQSLFPPALSPSTPHTPFYTCKLTRSLTRLQIHFAGFYFFPFTQLILNSSFYTITETSWFRPLCATDCDTSSISNYYRHKRKKWSKHNAIPRKATVRIFSII